MVDDAFGAVDFPVTPDEWMADHAESTAVTFLCKDKYEGVIPTPTPAAAHIDTRKENFQYKTSISSDAQALVQNDASVAEFMRTGWILSTPVREVINPADMEADVTIAGTDTPSGLSKSLQREPEDVTGTTLIHTKWAATVADGYALLITHPPFVTEDRFRTLPFVLDPANYERFIKVPITTGETETWKLRHGTPIAHVIPVPRRLLSAEYHSPTERRE